MRGLKEIVEYSKKNIALSYLVLPYLVLPVLGMIFYEG